ncbi:hypothetical protein [Streptomyces sp. NPDC002520]
MNHRPYPNVDRALAQLERGRPPQPCQPKRWNPFTTTGRDLGEALRAAFEHPRKTGKTVIVAQVLDQAVKAGQHVHVATRDGVRCASGAPACSLPSKEPSRCMIVASNEIDQKGRA